MSDETAIPTSEAPVEGPEPQSDAPQRNVRDRAAVARRARLERERLEESEEESDAKEFLESRGIDPKAEPRSRQRGPGRRVHREETSETEPDESGLSEGIGGSEQEEDAAPVPRAPSQQETAFYQHLADAIMSQGKGEDMDATKAFKLREENRLKRRVEELEGMVEALKAGGTPKQQETRTEEEQLSAEPPDLFEDPQGAVNWHVAKVFDTYVRPLAERLAAIEGATNQLSSTANRQAIRDLERNYESTPEGKGYFQRRAAYVQAFRAHLMSELDFSEDEANGAILRSDQAIQQLARARQKNPARLADLTYKMWLQGRTPQSAARQFPAGPDSQIAAAKAVADSPVAKQVSGGDQGTEAKRARMTPEQSRRLIAKGGKREFFKEAQKEARRRGLGR